LSKEPCDDVAALVLLKGLKLICAATGKTVGVCNASPNQVGDMLAPKEGRYSLE